MSYVPREPVYFYPPVHLELSGDWKTCMWCIKKVKGAMYCSEKCYRRARGETSSDSPRASKKKIDLDRAAE